MPQMFGHMVYIIVPFTVTEIEDAAFKQDKLLLKRDGSRGGEIILTSSKYLCNFEPFQIHVLFGLSDIYGGL